MNLRKNNGFSGIDMAISVLVILILIPTTIGVVYSLGQYKSRLSRSASSIDIAVEILEEAKGMAADCTDLDEVETYLNEKYGDGTSSGNFTGTINKDDITYKIEVTYDNPSQYVKTDIKTHLVKKVNVKVTYPLGKDTKDIEISEVLQVKNSLNEEGNEI